MKHILGGCPTWGWLSWASGHPEPMLAPARWLMSPDSTTPLFLQVGTYMHMRLECNMCGYSCGSKPLKPTQLSLCPQKQEPDEGPRTRGVSAQAELKQRSCWWCGLLTEKNTMKVQKDESDMPHSNSSHPPAVSLFLPPWSMLDISPMM